MVIDTTVLVDFFQDKDEAKEFIRDTREAQTSRVVEMELVRGLKSARQAKQLRLQLDNIGLEVLEIDKTISKEAGRLFESYFHSRGLGIMDAFVAATALAFGQKLATHNVKHFGFIKNLELIVPY